MSSPFDLSCYLNDFSGRAPLFPLPNCVLFPHILLPLHIFEPRYRRMTADALAADRLIAMALLKPDWDTLSAGGIPEIHEQVCLGRICAEERLPDGRYYIVLQGLARARVLEREIDDDRPYHVARLQLQEDDYPDPPASDRETHCRRLLRGFREIFPDVNLEKMFHDSDTSEIPLGVMCDVLAYAMKVSPPELQEVLEELDVDRRTTLVLRHLKDVCRRLRKAAQREFPPKFSMN